MKSQFIVVLLITDSHIHHLGVGWLITRIVILGFILYLQFKLHFEASKYLYINQHPKTKDHHLGLLESTVSILLSSSLLTFLSLFIIFSHHQRSHWLIITHQGAKCYQTLCSSHMSKCYQALSHCLAEFLPDTTYNPSSKSDKHLQWALHHEGGVRTSVEVVLLKRTFCSTHFSRTQFRWIKLYMYTKGRVL